MQQSNDKKCPQGAADVGSDDRPVFSGFKASDDCQVLAGNAGSVGGVVGADNGVSGSHHAVDNNERKTPDLRIAQTDGFNSL